MSNDATSRLRYRSKGTFGGGVNYSFFCVNFVVSFIIFVELSVYCLLYQNEYGDNFDPMQMNE